MSRASRQRLREAKLRQPKKKFRRLILVAVAFIAVSVFAWIYFHPKTKSILAAAHDPSKPRTLKELMALSPADLDKVDIGLMNLLCAEGLPGSENLDVQDCLKKLDGMADYVKLETQRHEYRFREHPEEFKNSRLFFEMDMLGTILVQDLHIQYNPAIALPMLDGKIPTQAVNANSKDIYIHGLLSENHYGTCASMPVLYVAIARRLGYPVSLAATKIHRYVYCQDLNGKHFNVEATMTQGFLTPPDEDYTNGPLTCTAEEVKDYGWLRPMSSKEVLGDFLDNRAVCLGDAKRYAEAKEMFLFSANCFPETPLRKAGLQTDLENLKEAPLGDKVDDWQSQIPTWEVPAGSKHDYLEGRKIQVRYFVGVCLDESASEKAMADLKAEIAEYQRQMALTNSAPGFMERGLILDISNKAGQELRIPAVILPPPLNRDNILPDSIANVNFDDRELVMNTLWRHYKDVTVDWPSQPALLPQH
jgi:hypothetical protein